MRETIKRIVMTLTAVMLTARAGVFTNEQGIKETYYNLNMSKVVSRADEALGMTGLYWVREDGVKMYGPWVIVAAHPSVTRYSMVQTSLGDGIVLDVHTTGDKNLYDIAVTW